MLKLSGNLVDLVNRRIYSAEIHAKDGKIASIKPLSKKLDGPFILPGFVDAHIHIESSMLVPSEFARLATPHGTVATVSDPHEIANVLGIEGVRFMINNGKQVPFHFIFGAPSCVPATTFETAGASLDVEELAQLFEEDKLKYLSEMMNYPGVLNEDPVVMKKIALAKKVGVPIDGHSPGLRGDAAARYFSAGITTDHECYTLEEGLDKAKLGVKILIREGSAAKNYEALHSLIKTHPEQVMFCSDDKHPDSLVLGHINEIVKRSLAHGYELFDVLRCSSYNPIKHYKLDVGLLQEGDSADFIIVDNLQNFNVLKTYIQGQLVAENGKTTISSVHVTPVNQFNVSLKKEEEFVIKGNDQEILAIEALDGELITRKKLFFAKSINHELQTNLTDDFLKICVVNRYKNAPVALGFIHGFGLKKGALASCVAHDSHNIIAVGVSDKELCLAVNAIIENKGGIAIAEGDKITSLPLPFAGIMSAQDGFDVAKHYTLLDIQAKHLGTKLKSPFMTLSFMALLVIPSLKLSDLGLFDGDTFQFIG